MNTQQIQISLFYCKNSLQEEELGSLVQKIKDVKINWISLPCSGKANLLYMLKAIETGADGVILFSCKFGECTFLQGNFRAQKRMEYVDELLGETGFGKGHVRFVSLEASNKTNTIITVINELAESLRNEISTVGVGRIK
jgi:F420-non-reducing hydrogenase iron-sulfur subunit